MFGSGVILASALVHMLSLANQSFANPCLPEVFRTGYGSFATAVCLFAILCLHLVQLLTMKYMYSKTKKHDGDAHKDDIETVREMRVLKIQR
jgi:hypothetical protein